MKSLLIKVTVSLSVGLITLAVFADRYSNYDAQGIWTSNSGSPSVEVKIKGSFVYARLINSTLPAIRLKAINSQLLNEYAAQFIKFNDYNNNGHTDIAVLKSVGLGGANPCYSVYEYKPDFYSYSSQLAKTVCIN